jgi:CelD/BcsL family acetyltransferase involved in cellulose biosynthesis
MRAPDTCPPPLALPLSVSVITDEAAFAALDPTWTALLGDTPRGGVFRSWPWCHHWWRELGRAVRRGPLPRIERELRICVARDRAGVVRGILPLYRERLRAARLVLTSRLRLIGDIAVGSDYLGVVARARDLEAVSGAFVGHLADEACEIYLRDLDADAPIAALAPAMAAPLGLEVTARGRSEIRYIDLTSANADFERFLAGRPEGGGAQWRRRLRWLERRPGFALTRVDTRAAIDGAMEELLRLHGLRWAGGGSTAFAGPRLGAFHREVARALAERGVARVYTLAVEGAVRAALYGFVDEGLFSYYQAGYDPAYVARSVGTVLLGAVIRDCFGDGLEFDFLRGDEDYKRRWATHVRHIESLSLSPSSTGARERRAVMTPARRGWEAVREGLPRESVNRLRRAFGRLAGGVP